MGELTAERITAVGQLNMAMVVATMYQPATESFQDEKARENPGGNEITITR